MEPSLSLNIRELRNWLQDHTPYRNEKRKEVIAHGSILSSYDKIETTYDLVLEFLSYYQYNSTCIIALEELIKVPINNIEHLITWVKKYEVLGSENLLAFEFNYDWKADENLVRIYKEYHTFKKPFIKILCFCSVFQVLYWDYQIDIEFPDMRIQEDIFLELKTILNN